MKTIFTLLLSFNLLLISAQHEWTRTSPGGGGAINVAGATIDGDIIVASDLSGIYKSTDHGVSFKAIGANQGLLETHVNAIGFDPNDGDTFYAGTYSYLFKTTDGGNSFDIVFPTAADPFDYSYIEDVVIAKTNSNIAYVTHHQGGPASFSKIFKTTNGGTTWNNVSTNFPADAHIVKLMVHPMNANYVYALSGKARSDCGDANLYRSTNGGVTWTLIGNAQGDILDMDLHPTNLQTVFISTFESNFQNTTQCDTISFENYVGGDSQSGALYKSTNGGVSFSEIGTHTGIISVGIENPNIITVLDILFPYDWNDDAGTWRTTNGGSSWTHTGFVANWYRGYAENQYFAFVGSFAGLNKTVRKDIFNSNNYFGTFGQWAWASFDSGVHMNNINSIEISENHWRSTGVENTEGHALDVNDANPNIIYMGGYDIGFWRSTDHGESWARSIPNYNTYPAYSWDLGTPGEVALGEAQRGAGSNVMNIVSDPQDPDIVWATFSAQQHYDPIEEEESHIGLFKSINGGVTWTLSGTGLPSYDESLMVYGLSLDYSSSLGNRTLYITVNGNVYKSANDGSSWTPVLTGHSLKFTKVDRSNGSIVYAGGKDGLWRTTNGGGSWDEVGTIAMRNSSANTRVDIVPTWIHYSNPIIYPWEGVFDIESDPNIAGRLYVTVHGPQGGLYRSDDFGITWSTNLFPDTHMRGIAVSPANSNIIYATSSKNYHSGGFGNSKGVQYSTDAGATWQDANDGLAFKYAGTIEVETGNNPRVWTWGSGTGVQYASVPFFADQPTVSLNLKAFLQGPYVTPLMTDILRSGNYIPLQEPYSGLEYNPSEITATTNTVLSNNGSNSIVDWVLVQARNSNNSSQVVHSKAALIQRDGDIVNPDGTPLTMAIPSQYSSVYIAVIHRNHFGVRTLNALSTNATITVDFTNPATQVFGNNSLEQIGNKMVFIAGDANDDGQINTVDINDYWRIFNSSPFSYNGSKADFNLDGTVNAFDRNDYWRPNSTKVEQLD